MSDVLVGGFRDDGRRSDQGRRLKCQIGQISHVPGKRDYFDSGSAVVEMGETKVIAQVVESPKMQTSRKVTAHVLWAAFATPERRMQRSNFDKKTVAIQQTIQNAFESLICPTGHARLGVEISVLSADGGVLACCLNATTLALIRAGVPLLDELYAACVVWKHDRCLIDPTAEELNNAEAELTLALTGRKKLISVMICESRISQESLMKMTEDASKYIEVVVCSTLRVAVRQHVDQLSVMSSVVAKRIVNQKQNVAT